MSYRVRFTLPDGRTGHWMREYETRDEAQQAINERKHVSGSDRRRLEALERWLRSKEDVSVVWMENRCLALNETGLAVDWGWSLAALADKLAERGTP